jgi:propanol-preferring alcohol dehydrogenase
VLAGIHMSDIPAMEYTDHLFYEKDLRTVTANTRADGAALLRLAQRLDITPTVTSYGFEDVGRAIDDLRSGRASGSLVIDLGRPPDDQGPRVLAGAKASGTFSP